MAQGGIKKLKPFRKRIKDQSEDIKKLYSLVEQRNTVQQISTQSQGQTSNTVTHQFLKTAGDTMVGPIAFLPVLITLTSSKTIDIGKDSGNFSSRVILANSGAFQLETISGAAHNGQILFLQGVQTETIVVTNAGNIETLDGVNFIIEDDDIILFQFDVTDNKWQQVTKGKQAIAASEVFTWTADHSAATFDLTNLDRLRFVVSSAAASSAGDPSNYISSTAMFWNMPTGDNFQWNIQNTAAFFGGKKITASLDSFFRVYGVDSVLANLEIENDKATPATGLIGGLNWYSQNDTTSFEYASIDVNNEGLTAGSEESSMLINVREAGSLIPYLTLNSGGVTGLIDVHKDIDLNLNVIYFDETADNSKILGTATKIELHVGGVEYMELSGGSVNIPSTTTLQINELFKMNATVVTGGVDGEMWHDSGTGDILCRSGGAERNLTNIGAGGVSFPIEPTITDNGAGWTGSQTLNLNTGDGHIYKWIIDQNLTFVAAVSNKPTSGTQRTFELEFEHDGVGGTFTITLPSNFKDESGNTITSLTISTGTKILTARINDGTNFLVIQKNFRGISTVGISNIVEDTTPQLGGTLDANGKDIDLNATADLIFDADGDTKMESAAEDTLKVWVNAVNTVDFLAGSIFIQGGIELDMNGNDIILDVDGDSKFNSTGDDAFQIELGTVNVLAFTASGMTMGTGTSFSMANEDITTIGNLLLGTSGASTASNPEIFSDGTSMFINIPSGDSLLFTTNAVNMFQMGTLSSGTFGQSAEAIHILKRIDSTPNDADVVGKLEFQGNNSAAEDDTEYARIEVKSDDVTDATEDGRFSIYLMSGGSSIEAMRLEPGGNWIYKANNADADLQIISDRSVGGDFATIRFETDNSSGTQTELARITASSASLTAGSEIGNIRFTVDTPSGSMATGIEIEGTGNGLTKISFHNAAPVIRQVISGARDNPEAALANLLTALANYGLITDSTTAS